MLNSETKSCFLQIRCTPTELARLRDLASGSGLTVSAFVLSSCLCSYKSDMEARISSLEKRYSELLYQFSCLKRSL